MKIPLGILFMMGTCSLYAEERIINYLAKVTNNSNQAFKLECSNFKWRPVLFSFTTQLTNLYPTYNDSTAQQNAEIERTKLDALRDQEMEEENVLMRDKGETQAQIEQEPAIQNYERLIAQQMEKLRPVIAPKQVIDSLPCRLFREIDTPSNSPTFNEPQPVGTFNNPKPAHWKLPTTCLKSDTISIKVIDTNSTQGCPDQRIRIEARSSNHSAYCCVENSGDMGRIHLTINADGTFSLERIQYTDYKP